MDERFTIDDVLNIHPEFPVPLRNSFYVDCPVCGKKKKFGIDRQKGTFHCFSCNAAGSPPALHGILKGLPYSYDNLSQDDYKELSKDYWKSVKGNASSIEPLKKPKIAHITEENPIAELDIRNKAYSALLDLLELSEAHRDNLRKRGLSDDAIEKNGYKSYPISGREDLCELLLNEGIILDGVPGFYKNSKGKWTILRLSSGILIPQCNGFGKIQGFQIRLDNTKGQRYITLSTGDPEKYHLGAKGIANPHISIGEKGLDNILLTEGPLKGDIISYFTDYTVLAIQGVNSLNVAKGAISDLMKKGCKKISICFDMDFKTNENVKKSLRKLEKYLKDSDILFEHVEWDEEYKGLDDWLLARKENKF